MVRSMARSMARRHSSNRCCARGGWCLHFSRNLARAHLGTRRTTTELTAGLSGGAPRASAAATAGCRLAVSHSAMPPYSPMNSALVSVVVRVVPCPRRTTPSVSYRRPAGAQMTARLNVASFSSTPEAEGGPYEDRHRAAAHEIIRIYFWHT